MMTKEWLRWLLVGLSALAGGCASPAGGLRRGPLPQEVTFWQPWLLNTARAPYKQLYVEVDAVRGAEPPQEWLDEMGAFLREQCDKPGGVRVVRGDLIAPEEAATSSVTSLALRYLNGPPPGSAYIYVLYYNSALNPQLKTTNPHAVVFPYPCAVVVDRNYNQAGFGDVLGGLILKHEVAHLLGAARDPSHGDGAHCGKRGCLMNPAFEYVPQERGMGVSLQMTFCEDCLRDMARWRAASAPGNLRFQGAYLARREAGYSVLTLPNAVHLHLGTEETLPTGVLWGAMKRAASGPLKGREGFILSSSATGSTASVRTALRLAAKDPVSMVRKSARLFSTQMDRQGLPP